MLVEMNSKCRIISVVFSKCKTACFILETMRQVGSNFFWKSGTRQFMNSYLIHVANTDWGFPFPRPTQEWSQATASVPGLTSLTIPADTTVTMIWPGILHHRGHRAGEIQEWTTCCPKQKLEEEELWHTTEDGCELSSCNCCVNPSRVRGSWSGQAAPSDCRDPRASQTL